MPMVYSAPKSHEGSYLHQRRESRGARCLEGTFATLRVLVPRSCGSTMDQHKRYHRLHKDADISSAILMKQSTQLIHSSVLSDHYYLNDTLTFDTLLKEEFGFSGIGILAIVHGLLHSLDRMSTRIVFLWSVGAKQYHADSRRRRCEKEVGGKLDGGEGVRGGEVKSCLLLCGVLEEWRSGARGPKKPDSGKGEGTRVCRTTTPIMMTTVVVTVVVVVVEGGKGEREREKETEKTKRRRAPVGPPWSNVRRIVSIHWRVERWGKKLRWRLTPVWKTSTAEHDVTTRNERKKKKEKILLVVDFTIYETFSSHMSHIDTVEQLLVPARVCRRRLHGVQIWQPYWTVVYPSSHQESLTPTLCIRVSRDVSHDALTRRSPVHCVGILRARAFIVRGSTRGALHN
ncbi:hypothetical protein ALC53_07879 [Atta colombica]|uniref:Uncharacterized protein n=1 Tax=Atta colombica TaxID=520822 RepID=A0A195BAZ1_9HYME|nr:hypothetical protein ALC53_07879 [Atta colombica]